MRKSSSFCDSIIRDVIFQLNKETNKQMKKH